MYSILVRFRRWHRRRLRWRILPSWIRWIRWTLPSWSCWSRSLRIRPCCPSLRRSLRCCPTRRCPSRRRPSRRCPSCQQIRCPSSTCYWRSPNRRKDRRTSRTMGIQDQILSNLFLVLVSEPAKLFCRRSEQKSLQWPKSFQTNQLIFTFNFQNWRWNDIKKEHQEDCRENTKSSPSNK